MLKASDSTWSDRVQQIGGIGPGGVVSRGKRFFFVYAYHEVGPKSLRSIRFSRDELMGVKWW
jgi:hypothetical protein